jgi:hypothetical protein
MGSASAMDDHRLLARHFGYLQSGEHQELCQELTRIRKMPASLLSTLESGAKDKVTRAAR